MEKNELSLSALAEERLRLEREAIAVERERLAAARARTEAEAKLAQSRKRPFLAFVTVLLLAALSFAGGFLTGISLMETRQQRQRDERIAKALSRLSGLATTATADGTNAAPVSVSGDAKPGEQHPNVSVLVIQ